MLEQQGKQFKILNFLFLLNAIYGIVLVFLQPSIQDSIIVDINKVQKNLSMNYLINVRVINDQSECSDKELPLATMVSSESNDYFLNHIPVYNNKIEDKQQLVKLCMQYVSDYNFISLTFLQRQYRNYSDQCQYQGIQFQVDQNTNQCPISDLFFSEEPQIEGYEKVSIENNNKLSLFLKRSDPSKTPVVDLYIAQKEESFFQKQKIISFKLEEICISKYPQLKSLCENERNLMKDQYSITFENQIPLRSLCNSGILFFDKNQIKHNEIFELVQLCGWVLANFCLLFLTIQNLSKSPDTGIILILSMCSISNLVQSYILLHDSNYLKTVIEETCTYSYNPLIDAYNNAYLFYILCFLLLSFWIILQLSPFVQMIIYKFKKTRPFIKFHNQELAPV